jgi:hypothetical protein
MRSYKLFILGLGLLVAALMIAIAAGVLSPTREQPTTPRRSQQGAGLPEVGGQQTAHQAYEKLTAWAAKNGLPPDIVSVSGVVQRGQPSETWTFQVYHQQRLSIVLVRGDEVRKMREQAALYKQQPLNVAAWSVDSDAVLSTWWERSGLAAWSQNTAQSLYVHLGRNATDALVWTITVLDSESNTLDIFQMDATNGNVVPIPTE